MPTPVTSIVRGLKPRALRAALRAFSALDEMNNENIRLPRRMRVFKGRKTKLSSRSDPFCSACASREDVELNGIDGCSNAEELHRNER